jgi:hypothetical protein
MDAAAFGSENHFEAMKSHWRKILSLLPASMERSAYERYFQKLDARWVADGKPLPVSYVSKHAALRAAAKQFNTRTLVETGTYLGDTLYMLNPDFETLYSIELSPQFHEKAKTRFREMKSIRLIQGDSGRELARLVPTLPGPALFWLDGHYSGGATARGDKDCPVLEELDAIFHSPFEHVIYIDDARLFTGSDDYPTLDALKAYVHTRKPGYVMEVINDCIRLTPWKHV